jgi:hypothetical protein
VLSVLPEQNQPEKPERDGTADLPGVADDKIAVVLAA